jgi:hypothetical protein
MIDLATKPQIQVKERILNLMKNDDSFLGICLLKLFEQQTIDERQIKNSVYRNSVGFNKPDAYILSDYSIWKLNFPERSINGELKTQLIKRLEKYALQLSSFKDVVAVLEGLKDPNLIINQVKNEVDVDKLDPNITLEDFLTYKRKEREVTQKERLKKKREEEQRKKIGLTYDFIKGAIVEIETRALKIKTTVDNSELYLWFPKFSIVKGYREELYSPQEFMIKKRILHYKLEDACGRK